MNIFQTSLDAISLPWSFRIIALSFRHERENKRGSDDFRQASLIIYCWFSFIMPPRIISRLSVCDIPEMIDFEKTSCLLLGFSHQSKGNVH